MDNQQGKTESQLMWLAGFIDGEGSFMWIRSKTKGLTNVRYQPYFKVAGTHYPTLDRVLEILDSQELSYHVEHRKPTNPKHKQSWMVVVSGYRRVLRLLSVLDGKLFTKQEDLQHMRTVIEERLQGNPKALYTPVQLELIHKLRRQSSD